MVNLSNKKGPFLLEEVDKKPCEALHHAYLKSRDHHQLIEQLDEQHMVFLAELSPIQAHIPKIEVEIKE